MWAITTHNLPSLRSFKEAEKFWAEAKPWKNQDQSWRPLDDRRMKHKRLVKNSDGGYECTLYNTALVTYYPNQVKLAFHTSSSSTAFMWNIRPIGCQLATVKGMQFWSVDTPEGERFYTRSSGGLTLNLVKPGVWELANKPDTVEEWVYNAKQGAYVRKLLKPYTAWYDTTKRIGATLPNLRWGVPTDVIANALSVFEQEPQDHSQFLQMAEILGPPEQATRSAYKHLGAYTKVLVPHDRLPRRIRI